MSSPTPRFPTMFAALSMFLLSACGGSGDDEGGQKVAATATQLAASTATNVTNPIRKSDAPPAVSAENIQLAPTQTPLVAGTINGVAAWPVWYGTGKPVDGVGCLVNGNYHKHALLSIYKDGVRLGLPDGIGRVHAGCYHAYEMHVHDVTGILHIEADTPRQFTLSQWFSLWQQPLSRDGTAGLSGPVRFYVIENGTITRQDGDPGQIAIMPHREILVVSGTPMTTVPNYLWPSGI